MPIFAATAHPCSIKVRMGIIYFMEYEYKVLPVKNMTLIEYQNLLNSMGRSGWQLVSEKEKYLVFSRAINIQGS